MTHQELIRCRIRLKKLNAPLWIVTYTQAGIVAARKYSISTPEWHHKRWDVYVNAMFRRDIEFYQTVIAPILDEMLQQGEH